MLGVGLCMLGCADMPNCDSSPREYVVELFSWWGEEGESQAAKAFIDLHTGRQLAYDRPRMVEKMDRA